MRKPLSPSVFLVLQPLGSRPTFLSIPDIFLFWKSSALICNLFGLPLTFTQSASVSKVTSLPDVGLLSRFLFSCSLWATISSSLLVSFPNLSRHLKPSAQSSKSSPLSLMSEHFTAELFSAILSIQPLGSISSCWLQPSRLRKLLISSMHSSGAPTSTMCFRPNLCRGWILISKEASSDKWK